MKGMNVMNDKYTIHAITHDKGVLKDKNTGEKKSWEGVRLCVQIHDKNGDTTKIIKASSEFPIDDIVDALSDSGCINCRLLFDEYGRACAYC